MPPYRQLPGLGYANAGAALVQAPPPKEGCGCGCVVHGLYQSTAGKAASSAAFTPPRAAGCRRGHGFLRIRHCGVLARRGLSLAQQSGESLAMGAGALARGGWRRRGELGHFLARVAGGGAAVALAPPRPLPSAGKRWVWRARRWRRSASDVPVGIQDACSRAAACYMFRRNCKNDKKQSAIWILALIAPGIGHENGRAKPAGSVACGPC